MDIYPAAERPRGRRALQLHLAALRRHPAARGHLPLRLAGRPRRPGSASATSTTRTRTSAPTARRPPPSTSRCRTSSARTVPARRLSATADPCLQPDAGQRVRLRPRAGAACSSGRWTTWSTRASHERRRAAAVPAAPIPPASCPAWRFGGVANQAFANTNFNGTPFDQKFIIHNVYESLTKMIGRHTLQGRRSSTSAPPTGARRSVRCRPNLAFGATPPAEHRPSVRQRAARPLRHLHAGRGEDHEQLRLPEHRGLRAGHAGRSSRT